MSCDKEAVFNQALFYTLGKVGKPGMVLKDGQITAIRHVYNGKDVFVWLPRYSKSICYKVLPFPFDYKRGKSEGLPVSSVVRISPLVSLMIN